MKKVKSTVGKILLILILGTAFLVAWYQLTVWKYGPKPRNAILLSNLNKYGRAGDLLLFSSTKMYQNSLQIIGESEWFHVGALVFDEDQNPCVLHTTYGLDMLDLASQTNKKNGIQISRIPDYMAFLNGHCAIRRFTQSCANILDITEEEMNKRFWDAAKELSHVPYNIEADKMLMSGITQKTKMETVFHPKSKQNYKCIVSLDMKKGLHCSGLMPVLFEQVGLWKSSTQTPSMYFPSNFDLYYGNESKTFGDLLVLEDTTLEILYQK